MHRAKIRDLYDELFVEVSFDHTLYAKVCNTEAQFVNKKQEHIEFFGGNLTGVEVVRFTQSDRDKLFHDLLHCDENELKERVYALKTDQDKPLINQEWVVTSDVFNISCIWLIHRFDRSTILSERERHEAKVRVASYLFYKFLTSLLVHYFKFPADRDTAQATYEMLSYKYALKQFGSWGETIRDLAEKAVNKESIYSSVVEKMDDDERVVRMIGDLQGRIRDMLKNIYATFLKAHQGGHRISTTSALVESDGEMILKDHLKSPGVYARYLKGIVSDRNTFIRPELLDVISSVMHTLTPRLLLQTLEWTSDNYMKVSDGRIEKAIDIVLEHAIEYMQINRTMVRTDLAGMIDKLRGAYMSSRSSDLKLLEARQLIAGLVKEATHTRNESMIATVRTAWMLYIVSRAYTLRYYTNH
jgi:hypothetical protein